MKDPNKPGLTELIPALIADQGMPVGLPYWLLCMTAMPYRELPAEQPYARHYATSTMTIEPGYFSTQLPNGDSQRALYGIPFGARARILMLYFRREILRTGQRELARSDSFRTWLQELGISAGGKTYQTIREQQIRIVACRLNFTFSFDRYHGAFNDGIVHGGVSVIRCDSDRVEYDTIILSQRFFDSVQDYPVPISESAIRQLANEPFALDIYCWLAAHLHRIESAVTFTWPQLHNYFGASYSQLRHFKIRFIEALKEATKNYSEAHIDVDDVIGIILNPSKPAD